MWFVVVKSDQDKTSVPLGLVTMYKYDLATTELNSMVLSSAELTKAKVVTMGWNWTKRPNKKQARRCV
ncbi:hypothetical protein PC120_g3396 [Phytophthora cactorum]|nr:hypothetical protein PC120_g3396 [Phytophthora cactorum]